MKLADEDLRALEKAISDAPDKAPVMTGTGGLRKIRLAPVNRAGGKSGGARVCYVHFAEFRLVYLCAIYSKNEKANLSAAERNAFRKLLEALGDYLRAGWSRGRTP